MANPERPDKILAERLDDQIDDLVLGINLFCGPPIGALKDVPAKSVYVWADGGPAAEPCKGEEKTRKFSNVNIRIRSDAKKYEEGLSLARSVQFQAHYAPLVGYLDSTVNESEPIYIGEDASGRPQWNLSVELQSEFTFDDANDPRMPDL